MEIKIKVESLDQTIKTSLKEPEVATSIKESIIVASAKGTIDILENGEYDVARYETAKVFANNGNPLEISNFEDMNKLLVAENLGKVYKYMGTSNNILKRNYLYTIVYENNNYIFKKLSTNDGVVLTLFTPSINLSDNKNLIINDVSNGNFVERYDIYSNEQFLTSTLSDFIDLTNYINVEGEYSIKITAKATNFEDSDFSNQIQFYFPVDPFASLLDSTLPENPYTGTSAILYGENAYIFGGNSSSYYKYYNRILKFNTTTETIETLNVKLPTARSNTTSSIVGNKVYIFGGMQYSNGGTIDLNEIVKFNIETEEITTLSTTLPSKRSLSKSVAIGNNIYIFSGKNQESSTITGDILKFDTTTETISTITSDFVIPHASCLVAIGTDIYIIGGNKYFTGNSSKEILKFDTITETIEILDLTLPKGIMNVSAVAVGTNIYIFNYNFSISENVIYKIDLANKTIKNYNDILVNGTNFSSAVTLDRKAYIFGGSGNKDHSKDNLIQKVVYL